MQKEIWKDIKNYEGRYQISNMGRVKSLFRKVKTVSGYYITVQEKILKQTVDNTGYYVVSLWKNNKHLRAHIHRLVAETFIFNHNNKPFINHIDGDKLNNNVSNLEWCTPKENNIHAYQYGLNPSRKKVNQYDLKGNFIKTWDSIKEANDYYKTTHISECCNPNSKRNITKGFLWKHANK